MGLSVFTCIYCLFVLFCLMFDWFVLCGLKEVVKVCLVFSWEVLFWSFESLI